MPPLTDEQRREVIALARDMANGDHDPSRRKATPDDCIAYIESLIAQAEAAAVERCAVALEHGALAHTFGRHCAAAIRSLTNPSETP